MLDGLIVGENNISNGILYLMELEVSGGKKKHYAN